MICAFYHSGKKGKHDRRLGTDGWEGWGDRGSSKVQIVVTSGVGKLGKRSISENVLAEASRMQSQGYGIKNSQSARSLEWVAIPRFRF